MMEINWIEQAAQHALTGHALFGPSTLPRVMRCPGSVRLCLENNAKPKPSEYAQEGSNAHELARKAAEAQNEVTLYEGRELSYYSGGEIVSFTPDADMVKGVQEYVDWCQELPGEHFIETRVDLTAYMPAIGMEVLPDQFGTADHAAVFLRTLIVTDLKFGMGEQVFAENNEQLMTYGLGFYHEWSWMYDIDRIVLRICQPRLNHYDSWECSATELLEFGERLRTTVEAAMQPNPSLFPGEVQCRFCPMSGRCAAQTAAAKALVAGDFNSFDEPQPYQDALSYEDLGKALGLRETVKHWLKALSKQAFDALQADIEVPGWKIVEARSRRCWIDEADTEKFLTAHKIAKGRMFEKKLISPAQAEKLFKGDEKKELTALARKPPGQPVLAPLSDRRPPYVTAASDFDNFDEFNDELVEPETVDDGLGE